MQSLKVFKFKNGFNLSLDFENGTKEELLQHNETLKQIRNAFEIKGQRKILRKFMVKTKKQKKN